MEREKLREREPELHVPDYYESIMRMYEEIRQQASTGKVVIRAKELGWQQGRQGLLKYYLHPHAPGMVTTYWDVFVHDIRHQSGRHRHQGGLSIYVIEGSGYTLIDGVKIEWEAGDLILLPIKPSGVEHQHFNREPGKPCKWLAFIFLPYSVIMGGEFTQVELSPDWVQTEQTPPGSQGRGKEQEHYF